MEILELIYKVLFCYFLGEFMISSDFIQRTKNKNKLNLFAHCICAVAPFLFVFGFNYQFLFTLISHFIIDFLRSKKKIEFKTENLLHMVCLLVYGVDLVIPYIIK